MIGLSPYSLFEKLFSYYGPQNWWPGEGYEIAIGAILTQNTSWKNVEIAIKNLKKNNLLSPEKIVKCSIEELKELIRPAGFFNQKAVYLKELSIFWTSNSNPSRDELLSIKGVGEETADAILLYLLNKAEFVIDSYTIRLCTRIGFANNSSISFWKNFFQENLPKEVPLFNEFHALIVIHAKNFCAKRNPLCSSCFLLKDCDFGKKRTMNLF